MRAIQRALRALGALSSVEFAAVWSALVLVIGQFLNWYGVEVVGPLGQHGARGTTYGGSTTGWDSLHGVRVALLAAAALTGARAALIASGRRYRPRVTGLTVTAAGAIAFGLIAWRLLEPPIHAVSLPGAFEVRVSLSAGGFVSLLAAGGMALWTLIATRSGE